MLFSLTLHSALFRSGKTPPPARCQVDFLWGHSYLAQLAPMDRHGPSSIEMPAHSGLLGGGSPSALPGSVTPGVQSLTRLMTQKGIHSREAVLIQKSQEAFLLASRLGTRVEEAQAAAETHLAAATAFQERTDAASRHLARAAARESKRRDTPMHTTEAVWRDMRLLAVPDALAAEHVGQRVAQPTQQDTHAARGGVTSGSIFDPAADAKLIAPVALRTPVFLIGRRDWVYPDDVDASVSCPTLPAVGKSASGTPRSTTAATQQGSIATASSQHKKAMRGSLVRRKELAAMADFGRVPCPLGAAARGLSRTERVGRLRALLQEETTLHVGRFAESVQWEPSPDLLQRASTPGMLRRIADADPGPATARGGAEGGAGLLPRPSSGHAPTPVQLPMPALLSFVVERIELGARHVPVALRYSRSHFRRRFLTQPVASMVRALTWLVHCMTWRAHGTKAQQEVLLTLVAFLYQRLLSGIRGPGTDSFFQFLLPAAAEAVWCALYFSIPGSRGHYDAALKLRLALIVCRVVSGSEMSPSAVLHLMHSAFPDATPDAPIDNTLVLNSSVLGDAGARLGGGERAEAPASSSPAQAESHSPRHAEDSARGGGDKSIFHTRLASGTDINDALASRSLLDAVHMTPAQRAALGTQGAYEFQTLRALPEHAFVPHTAYTAAYEYAHSYLVQRRIMGMVEEAARAEHGVEGDDAMSEELQWRVEARKRAAAHSLAMQLIKQRVKYRDISVQFPLRSTSTNLQRMLPGVTAAGASTFRMKLSTLTPWSSTGSVDTFCPILQRLVGTGELPADLHSLQASASEGALPQPGQASAVAAAQTGDAPALQPSASSPDILAATTRQGADAFTQARVDAGVPPGHATAPAHQHVRRKWGSINATMARRRKQARQAAAASSATAASSSAAIGKEVRRAVASLRRPGAVQGVEAAARLVAASHRGVHPARRRDAARASQQTHESANISTARFLDGRRGCLGVPDSAGGLPLAAARKVAATMFGESPAKEGDKASKLHAAVAEEVSAAAAASASLAATLQRARATAGTRGAGEAAGLEGDPTSGGDGTVDRSGMKAVAMGPLATAGEVVQANFSPLNPAKQHARHRYVRMALPSPNPLMRLHRSAAGSAAEGDVLPGSAAIIDGELVTFTAHSAASTVAADTERAALLEEALGRAPDADSLVARAIQEAHEEGAVDL